MSGLTDFQVSVAHLFFSLPASEGFLLAGGGALLASGLSDRPTTDLDFFGQRGIASIQTARDQLEAASNKRGWTTTRIRDSETFVRLLISGEDELIIDIAIDAPPGRPPVVSIVGPVFDPEELAGRKLIALFDRAEARDFADVYALAQRFGTFLLLERAKEVDTGFNTSTLVEMLRTLSRFSDDEIPVTSTDRPALRHFFQTWADELAVAES